MGEMSIVTESQSDNAFQQLSINVGVWPIGLTKEVIAMV
jgi:hypothetical protein